MAEQFETMVKVYKDTSEYQKEAQKLAKKGWQPLTVTERKPRAGCVRLILLWWLVLIIPPKPELVVTYQRSKAQAVADAEEQALVVIQPGHCPNCGVPVTPTAYYCPNCKLQLRH